LAVKARQLTWLVSSIVVVYFIPPAANTAIVDTFYQDFMGQVARQDFRPILLWELEAEQVLAQNNPALLPFVPLMRGGDNEQMVRRCAERIRQEPQAAELETILALFASYVLETTVIKQILRWEMEIVQESPLMKELREAWFEKGIEQGVEKGIEQGREEGERKATLKALHQTLTIRFGIDLEKFDERFASLDLKMLEHLNEVALTFHTLPDFETTLTELLSTPEDSSDKSQSI
jgi:predicted transposase YdaD